LICEALARATAGAFPTKHVSANEQASRGGFQMARNKILIFAAIAEVVTGLALLIVPSLVGRLLLGDDLNGIATPVARVAGIALIALGLACWPGPPVLGMLTYSALVTLYLAYLGIADGLTGVLLWPAVALHLTVSVLLGRALATETS